MCFPLSFVLQETLLVKISRQYYDPVKINLLAISKHLTPVPPRHYLYWRIDFKFTKQVFYLMIRRILMIPSLIIYMSTCVISFWTKLLDLFNAGSNWFCFSTLKFLWGDLFEKRKTQRNEQNLNRCLWFSTQLWFKWI